MESGVGISFRARNISRASTYATVTVEHKRSSIRAVCGCNYPVSDILFITDYKINHISVECFRRVFPQLGMAIGDMLATLRPIVLIILLALQRSETIMLHSHPASSLNTPQIKARAEQAVTLKPYTGNGAV